MTLLRVLFAALQLSIGMVVVSAATQDGAVESNSERSARDLENAYVESLNIDEICKYCKFCDLCDKCPCTGMDGCEHCDKCALCWLCKWCPKPDGVSAAYDSLIDVPHDTASFDESEIHLEYLVRCR